MKRNQLKKILAVFTAVSMLLLVFNPAVLAEGKEKQHGYGYRPATAAEKAEYDKHATKAKYVLPNKTAIQRINEVRQKDGLEPLPESLGVPVGQEMLKEKGKPTKAQGITLKAMGEIYGADPMPTSVDNSEDNAFPTIGDQGSVGSCAAFAATYYMATYERAKALGLDAKTDAGNRLSPKFSFNLINGGFDHGTSMEGNINSIYNTGALTMVEFPYDGNYTAWPTSAALWRSALTRKSITDDGYIAVDFPEETWGGETYSGLASLKTILLDGKVVTFGTYIDHWNWATTGDDPSTEDDHPGEHIATSMDEVDYETAVDGHAMTAVGYDDHVWVDMDGDTNVDDDEKGAIKVANSWGTDWEQGNGGYAWIAYAALLDSKYNEPYGEDDSHPSIFGAGYAYYVTFSDEAYTPDVTAEIELTTNDRYQLTALTGFNWSETDEPCSDIDYGMEDYYQNYYDINWVLWEYSEGAALSLDGTTENHTGTIVLDLSYSYEEWKDKGGALTYCLGIEDSAKAGGHTIHSITFKDEKSGQTFTPDGLGSPYEANSSTGNRMKWFSQKHIPNPDADVEPYQADVAILAPLQLGVPVSKTYYDGDNYSWKFTPTETGKYKIAQNKSEIEIGVENEARNPLLLQNDPSGNGNITATLYAGRTYVIDAYYEEYDDEEEEWDEGEYGGVFPVNATITITKVSTAPSSSASADLASLTSTSTNALSPAFSPATCFYTLKASGASTTFTATLADSDAYAVIDGKVGTSKTVSLNPGGSKEVRVDIFAKDWSKSKTYRIYLTRPVSTDATLSNIQYTSGSLYPAFTPGRTSYTLTLGEFQGSTTLTPVTSSDTATYTIDRQAVASKLVSLDNGRYQYVKIVVKPQTGRTKTYTIKVVREKSNNADLASLSATVGSFDSTFTPTDTSYKLTLGEYEGKTRIYATKYFPKASLSPSSKSVSLNQGQSKTVTFRVRSQSGKVTQYYTVTVERAQSTDANLKSLRGVRLSTPFNKDVTSYTAAVSARTRSVTLSPSVNNRYAKVAYYIGGMPCTRRIAFANPGDSVTVEVRVTAQHGETKSYFITITRNLV